MFCFKISFQMRNYPLSAAQGVRHSDCIKITDKFKCDVKLADGAKSPAFIETVSLLKEHDWAHVGSIREKRNSSPLNQYHLLQRVRSQTNVLRQKMKHFNPSINSIYKSISHFIYNMYTDV